MKFIKNKFLFIILISLVTLVLLIVGGLSMYQDHSSVFDSDGYIIETTTKANNKYYFSANTKYKENVDNKITFSDQDSNKVSVDPASFVHYLNGNVSFLKKGALVNLSDLSNPMVSYYNINDNNVISYENDGYTVSSNGKTIHIDSFIGRISDNKYLISGKNLSLKVPKVEETIDGDYFEVLFVEEGIVKIDNRQASYQVTAQDSYIYVGDEITISLGDGKIFYKGDAKMLLSQITINGDENIDLDVQKETNTGGGSGDGTGDGTGNGTGDGTGDGTGLGENGDVGTESGDGTGDGTESGESGNGLSDGNGLANGPGNVTTASPQIELIDAIVTSTAIDLSLQLNNAALAKGDIVYYITNVATGEKVDEAKIDLTNGTFKIIKESLSPSTEYAVIIGELNSDNGRQFFQKTFRTEDLGISLEKLYATDSSLSYQINFEENSNVTMARIVIYDSNGSNKDISPNEYLISATDLIKSVTFKNLNSNSNYSVLIDTVWINSAAYSNVYSISRIDSTLKKTPVLSGVDVSTNSEEVKFTLQLKNVSDPDNAITNYVYNVYRADDITADNPNPEVIYSVSKNDTDPLVLDLNKIAELKTGVDYRAKIVARYHDNEMIREVSTEYSSNFLIKSKPNITFEPTSVSMNKVSGILTLTDGNCSVPILGRSCLSRGNNFVLRYYKMKDSEAKAAVINNFSFNSNTLSQSVVFDNLSSKTTYVLKLYGNYYDDNNVIHENVQIGDTLYFTTDKSENLHFEVSGDNKSNGDEVVTFNAKLSAPQEKLEEIIDAVSSINLNLYSGRYTSKEKLIGNYRITEDNLIRDFFNNFKITNGLFTDTTKFNLGLLKTSDKLKTVTNNLTNTLNSDYTVEVEGVYYSNDSDKFFVEDGVYTFHLTSSFYLDTRIHLEEKDKSQLVVTPITKEQLSNSEYEDLSKNVSNLDDLNKDTVVGVVLENTLSDLFVDSAFTYEKVVLQYSIKNLATGHTITSEKISDLAIDMGNKYQPKELTIYLDPSDMDDGKNFTRGYDYEFSYSLHFVTEDGSNPIYTNPALSFKLAGTGDKNHAIYRQDPIYTLYISNSSKDDITYRYTFSDIDGALFDRNFYYKKSDSDEYVKVDNSLNPDKQSHDVVLPIGDRGHFSLCYAYKNTSNKISYKSINEYDFEKEYTYQNEISYQIVDDHDNMLKIRFENNDFTNRATAYRVVIKEPSGTVKDTNGNPLEYSKYFLAYDLETVSLDTGNVDDNGEKVMAKYRYIAIDYANISKFMKHNIVVNVYAYYDSGLVGLRQDLSNGFILKGKDKDNKDVYLNTFNNNSDVPSFPQIGTGNMGIYYLETNYNDSDKIFSVYNGLKITTIKVVENGKVSGKPLYDKGIGVNPMSGKIDVINYKVSSTNQGLVFTSINTDYVGYNPKVLKEANLNASNKNTRFDSIVPIVTPTVTTTINSVKVSMNARGIYGNGQFVKDGSAHRKVYVTFYSDEEKTNVLETITSDVSILGNDDSGYRATIGNIEYKNLVPATTYYFTISAYINGRYTQLYDNVKDNNYILKTYSAKTLDGKGILGKIKFYVSPSAYNGEISKKTLDWKLELKDTSNYKIRFELYAPDGTLEDGSIKYKAVKFDGSDASSCNSLSYGNSSNAYISNCYISIDKSNIASINNALQSYIFTGDNFVFGDGYYKLVVYAIPYTNGSYIEDQKVILYQNDKLSTHIGGSSDDIDVSALMPATFRLDQENDKVKDMNQNGPAYVRFKPHVNDKFYVMKYGKYRITLQDSSGAAVENCVANVKDDTHNFNDDITLSPCIITLDYVAGDTEIEFSGGDIKRNTPYFVDFSYDTYRNNVDLTESEKVAVSSSGVIIYSPVGYGISIGNVTASLVDNHSVAINYNGSFGLSGSIKEIIYTISLNGVAGGRVSGTYSLRGNNANTQQIFTVASGGDPRFVIDVANEKVSNDINYTFKNGNSYFINLQYYIDDGTKIGDSSLVLNL